ncbi:MAG: right-handed parallel beta-helix repeat-containing protein [Acidimicrobiia bacterium]|nr:right-handed parallel beta-helix repeat-containing protein [Acidimicrobiia bacterium]
MTRTILMLTLLLLGIPACGGKGAVTHFYVSTEGNDAWSGRLPAPNAETSDGPFATLERARETVRQLKSRQGPETSVTVYIRGGKYSLSQPFLLEPADSGTARNEVRYAAYQDEKPVISGGRKLSGWKPFRGEIVRTDVSDIKEGKWIPAELFFNGERQRLARYPNFDPKEPAYGGWVFAESSPKGAETSTLLYEPGAFPRTWSKPEQGQVAIFPWYCWVNDIVPIGRVDPKSRTITFARPIGHFEHDAAATQRLFMHVLKGNRFYVQNLLEELDEPGEWCVDKQTGTLYFWPPEPLTASSEVSAPALSTLFHLKGSDREPVQYVSISGLTLTQTQTDWPEKRNRSFHSPALKGHAIQLENAAHCTIEKNLVRAPGGDGIRLQGYTAENAIRENEILLAGGMGITVTTGDVPGNTHTWKNVPELDAAYANYKKAVRNTISGNRIHNCGVTKKNGGGIHFFGVASVDNRISDNTIYDLPDKAMTFQDGLGRIIVERNHLYHLALEIADTGAIMFNRWFPYERDPDLSEGHVVRQNWIHDVKGCGAYDKPKVSEVRGTKAGGRIWTPYFAWGIYFDNSPVKANVQQNVVARAVLGGFGMPVGDPKDVLVENNIFVESSATQVFLRLATATGFRFRHNIVYYTDPKAALLRVYGYQEGAVAECDRNLYFDGGRKDLRFEGGAVASFSDWQKLGHDTNSVIADPLFMDPSKDDYRLKTGSPALPLGFKPIEGLPVVAR